MLVLVAGWASASAQESKEIIKLQDKRKIQRIDRSELKAVFIPKGIWMTGVAVNYHEWDNDNLNFLVMKNGVEDRAASRRVEVYLIASEEMIKAAENGTLQ